MNAALDWPMRHADIVERFRAGWDRPAPHAWDSFLGPRMEFVQPMLRRGVGPPFWQGEVARILALVPDLRADVLSWSGTGNTLFIHLRLAGTLAGQPLTWDAVDVLRMDDDGTVIYRESFFDSIGVARQVVRRPGGWWRWWRSGVGPFIARRRLLRPFSTETPTRRAP